MDMYDGLAQAYDELFPTNPATLLRLAELGLDVGTSLMDSGCASGGHVLGMAARGVRAVGIDPSTALLAKAREAATRLDFAPPGSATFVHGGMLDLGRPGLEGPYDCLLCLGNTLPHLRDEGELELYLALARQVLNPGALFVLQVLDYESLLATRPPSLPELETPRWRFERRYRWLEGARVEFSTRLVERASSVASEGRTLLRAFTRSEILQALEREGFEAKALAGDWSARPFAPGSDKVLAIEARRRA